jgi:arginase
MLMVAGDPSSWRRCVGRWIQSAPHVGLTETTPFEADFIRMHGITRPGPEDLAGSPERVLEWLCASGYKDSFGVIVSH